VKTWVTKELASYAVRTGFEDYPQAVVDQVKVLILDSIGCMFGGCQTDLGRAILDPIRNMAGNPESTLIGGGARVPTIQAAFVNGTTANALDYDDTLFGMGHPGASVIPAALAVGEWRHANGRDVISAILAGYDVGDRIGLAIQPSYERLQKVWGVGTWQTFSAAVAAAKVLNLDLDRTLNAYGVAGATAPLPNTQKWGWSLDERPIHWVKEPTGWPAWTGTTAAILASHGFVGNRYILDGDNGFWIMAGSDRCDFAAMTRGLGSQYEVLDNIAIKPYSSCRWQHATLDCVRELKLQHKLELDDVQQVVIHSFAWACTQELYGPANLVDAQFCIPYTVTMLLMGVHPGPAWYTQERLRDPEIERASRKVRIKVDPELDRAYFDTNQLSARVEIYTQDGRRLETFVDTLRGDPRKPLAYEEIEAKFRNQAEYVLGPQQIDRAIDRILHLEELEDITDLTALLAGEGR
jgi:2-methylcitrate dehydratase PrpD